MSQKIDRGVGIPKEEAKSTDKNKVKSLFKYR